MRQFSYERRCDASGTNYLGFDSYETNHNLKGNLTYTQQIKLKHVKRVDLFSKLRWGQERNKIGQLSRIHCPEKILVELL